MSEVKENKGFVTPEYLKKVAEDAKFIKKKSYELMELQSDSQVLDVGCGPAIDTIELSNYIGANGRIVGIDNDPLMIEKANFELKQHNITKQVQHLLCDVQSLPFDDNEFDRVHAERLFQVLPRSVNATHVFSEINRVLKSKGRMVLVDADWGSASVNFSDNELERILLKFFATKMRPNGFAGRQLLELLKDHNYENVTIEVVPFITRDFKQTPFSDWLTKEALKNKIASERMLDQWNKELAKKTSEGTFLSYINMVLVAGRKI